MIQKTTGIVLRISPFSRTSHVVTWITPDHGKITTIVKGARRPKSAFLGQYDLFYRCDLLFYSRERNGVHAIRECSPIDTRKALRGNWRATLCASYFSDLVSRISAAGNRNPELFSLLDKSLMFLASEHPSKPLIFWFELKSMENIGLSPQLTRCLNCHRELAVSHGESGFSYSRGGLLCPACTGSGASRSDREPIIVGPDVIAAMQEWQKMSSPEAVEKRRHMDRHLIEIANMLGMFLEYHLQATSRGRAIAMELLN